MACGGIRRALQNYTRYHVGVFVLTFCSYAFFHATRKTFSNVKTTMTAVWTASPRNGSSSECLSPDALWNQMDVRLMDNRTDGAQCITPYQVWDSRHVFSDNDDAEQFMGTLDACFMFSYALGLFVSGYIADRNDLRLVLSIGMSVTAVLVFVFGCVLEWVHLYSKPLYVVLWLLNGFVQSTGWPSVVAVMGNWFGKGSRGFVMGLWSACASVGNIIGALLVAAVLDYGYEYAFLMTSSVLFAGALLNFFGLVPSPLDVGLPLPADDEVEDLNCDAACVNRPLLDDANDSDDQFSSDKITYAIQDTRPKAIKFVTALLLPGVLPYSLCYAFLKLVNYSFFFWLPFYLASAYGMAETVADTLSIWYDVGGIVGGTVAGFISDRLHKRAVVCMPMLITAIPVLFVYGLGGVAGTQFINGLLLFILGWLIGGVANLISAAISADLGRQKALKGNAEALSTVTGIIDGTGSLGAALGQVAVPQLQVRFGWHSVFYLFMVSMLLTAACIIRIFILEVKEAVSKSRYCMICRAESPVEILKDYEEVE